MSYTSEPFDPDHHDVSGFDCGEESLNLWLRRAGRYRRIRRPARTWLWVDEDGSIAGYYALASHRVRREEVPSRVGRGGPAEIPAALLARLALDNRLRGQQLGPILVADALTRVVAASRIVAARLVVVDALHEKVAGFYEQLGFRCVPGSLTLVLTISDAEAAIEHAN